VDRGRYRKAFFECRKHRIDLNVIVDRNLEKFINDIPSFVDQVQEVDHINLLLTLVGYVFSLVTSLLLLYKFFIRRCNSSPEVVAKVCNAFRRELEMRNLTTYVNSILTAHVVKSPPDHEAGLSLLLRLRGQHCVMSPAEFFLADACMRISYRFLTRYRRRRGQIYHFPRRCKSAL